MSGDGPERHRVAELIVTHAGGQRRGSGYRITAGEVLTAAHVLADAAVVLVRFEPDLPDEWTIQALAWQCDPAADIASVTIEPRPDEASVSTVQFGRVGYRAAVLTVQAVGFPRWKLRTEADGSRFRDAYHLVGSMPVLSNWRENTMEVVIASPPAPDPNGSSPWEGMSGAAVWVGGRIVGVVAKHHPSDGLGRLAAVRYPADGLPDVVPASAEDLTTTAYRAEVADIAPVALVDRDGELAELVRFCAGDEPYKWWQAGPWAGKSALLSWFALHPPVGVDVVSFFVTSRFAGQSDSDAFTEALIEQLAALVGEPPQSALESRARSGHVGRLLTTAAERCVATGRRLLLVVDGLDEDTSQGPSIAALLPRRPPDLVRVLVASRPHPELPSDVPGDHPLRFVVPQLLSRSDYANHLALKAKNELAHLLSGPPLYRDVLGLITAAGGGLTRRDLEELTGEPPFQLDALFGGVFGRSLEGRQQAAYLANRPPDRVYLFAHETLRRTAEEQFGASVSRYRDQLHAWADGYRRRGWPADTPTYLLRGYRRMLADAGAVSGFVTIATDRVRLDRMRDLAGGDALALTELTAATDLVASQPDPDHAALVLLALTREDVAERNDMVPTDLPAVWAALGEPVRALALANGMRRDERRAEALAKVATTLARRHDRQRAVEIATDAEAVARRVHDADPRTVALGHVAVSFSAVGKDDDAVRIADDAMKAGGAATPPTIEALARAGSLDRAEECVRHSRHPVFRAEAAAALVTVLVDLGQRDRAVELAAIADAAAEGWGRSDGSARAAAVTAWATIGERERASMLAIALEEEGSPTAPRALVALRELDRAERVAARLVDEDYRARALTVVAVACADAGDQVRAAALAGQAETIARESVNPYRVGDRPGLVAIALAGAGDFDRGERLAAMVEYSTERMQACCSLAALVARSGDHTRARALMPELDGDGQVSRWALVELATAEALVGDMSDATGYLGWITNLDELDRAVRVVAVALAEAGQREKALELVNDMTLGEPDQAVKVESLATLALVWARGGEMTRAVEIAREVDGIMAEYIVPDAARTAAVEALAAVGEFDSAERYVAEFEYPYWRWDALTTLAVAAADRGNPAHAMELAESAEAIARDPDYRHDKQLLGTLASRLASSNALSSIFGPLVRGLVTEVLVTDDWTAALPAVGRLDLPALQRVCDMLLAGRNDPAANGWSAR